MLLAVLGLLLVTGLLKALWINHAMTDNTVNPGWDNPSQARLFLGLGLVGPIAVLITYLLVSRPSRSRVDRLLLAGKVGCLVVVLPWLMLMMSGVSA